MLCVSCQPGLLAQSAAGCCHPGRAATSLRARICQRVHAPFTAVGAHHGGQVGAGGTRSDSPHTQYPLEEGETSAKGDNKALLGAKDAAGRRLYEAENIA